MRHNDFMYNSRPFNRDNRDNRDKRDSRDSRNSRNRVPPITRVQNSPPRGYAKSDDSLDILPINYDNAMKKREVEYLIM